MKVTEALMVAARPALSPITILHEPATLFAVTIKLDVDAPLFDTAIGGLTIPLQVETENGPVYPASLAVNVTVCPAAVKRMLVVCGGTPAASSGEVQLNVIGDALGVVEFVGVALGVATGTGVGVLEASGVAVGERLVGVALGDGVEGTSVAATGGIVAGAVLPPPPPPQPATIVAAVNATRRIARISAPAA